MSQLMYVYVYVFVCVHARVCKRVKQGEARIRFNKATKPIRFYWSGWHVGLGAVVSVVSVALFSGQYLVSIRRALLSFDLRVLEI